MTGIVPRIVASGAVLFGLSSAAHAANDTLVPAMGHGIALQICTQCHLVEPGQVNPPDHVGGPSFQTIANGEDVTVAKLRKHLRTTEVNKRLPLAMPNPALTPDEENKLVAYIISLRTGTASTPPAK
ncbi:MAG TPA: c-type cytochrome [Alphaproteobacteria bacterium]|nr:c-type cytochrome [Alphaproteobacteria bacterium]